MSRRAGRFLCAVVALTSVALSACQGGEAGRSDASGEAAAPDAEALVVDAGAGMNPAAPDSAVPLAFVSGPTFTLAPNPAAPLSGRLELGSNRPTRLTIAISDPERAFTIALAALATRHEVPVLGFRPATRHTVTVTIADEGAQTLAAAPFDVTTGALPARFPTFTTERVVPAQIEPGVTLTGMGHYLVAVDAAGAIVWFVDAVRFPEDVRRLPAGTFLANFHDFAGGAEIDVFGNVLARWHPANAAGVVPDSTPVAADTFHHELGMLPSGELFTLGTERRSFPHYPTSDTDPTPRTDPADVIGDVALVFRRDGTVVHRWAMLDMLDPYRIGYGSFNGFWDSFYPAQNMVDWSHGNALTPDPADGGFLVSLRHQDAVLKLDAAGKPVWILGTHDNWGPAFAPFLLTPVGTPFAWQFHQHAPKILSGGNILVFDNGTVRVTPPTPRLPGKYSRAVEFAVDPAAMSVRQIWEYDAGRSIYAPTTGDVDVGPMTGNVIVTFGGASRIVEVTHADPAVVVFRMTANAPFYRAKRLPSLYP